MVISNLPLSLKILVNHLHTCNLSFTSVASVEEADKVLAETAKAKKKINCVLVDIFSQQFLDEMPDLKNIISQVGEKQVIILTKPLQRPKLVKIYPRATFLLKPVTFSKLVQALHGRCANPLKTSADKEFIFSNASRVLIVEGIYIICK